jgi:hypothetical protein
MADTWLAVRWCPACGLGIYVLIATTARRLPRGQPPEACRCVRRDANGQTSRPWWRRLCPRPEGPHELS